MTRRNLVILILVLVAAAVLLQRTLRKQKEQAPAASAVSSEPEAAPQQHSHTSASESRDMPAREAAMAEMQPRETREPRLHGRGKANDTANAQLQTSSFFADTSWKIWAGVRAVPKKNGMPQKNFKGEVNGYYLVEDGVAASAAHFSSSQPLVVVDTRLNTVGVVTGTFTVVLKEGVSADIFAQIPEVKIVNEFPNINTYYVTAAKEPFDLLAFKEFLKGEPGVVEVQPEILSRHYEKY